MTYQNDISKRHIDNQNDISKITNEIIGLFKNPQERTLYISVKKLEKIVAALYLVTDVMDAEIPLTKTLRVQSLEMLSGAYQIIFDAKLLHADRLVSLITRIDHTIGLVHIGTIAHHISSMNASIIIEELEAIRTVIYQESVTLSDRQSHLLQPGIMVHQPVIPQSLITDELFQSILKTAESKRQDTQIKESLVQNDIKTTNQKDITNQKDTLLKKQPVDLQSFDRKQKILDTIKGRVSCTINDIKKAIPELNDKAIQRELLKLISMGIITKEGNKRWTIYRVI